MTSEPQNKSDQAFVEIERMIVLGEIAPGSLVSEKQLMELTGLGRTPVREAVQRLSRGGCWRSTPTGECWFRPPPSKRSSNSSNCAAYSNRSPCESLPRGRPIHNDKPPANSPRTL